MSDIFREIDEELRRDNLLQLWSRYGRYVIAGAVVALLVAGAVAVWVNHERTLRQAQSTRFGAALAMASTGKEADAARVFTKLAAEGGGYGKLASFEQAELLAKTGDGKGAVAAYDRIAASGDLDAELRDLAVLLAVMHGPLDSDPKAAIARLAPLTVADNPWRPTALEMTAVARLKTGDAKGARDLYKSLADDLKAPQGLRARAAEMVAALAP